MSRRKRTTKEFIEESVNLHGIYYDYSKVTYKGIDDRVIIICPVHGEFEQTPYKHLIGRGCNKCRRKDQLSKSDALTSYHIKLDADSNLRNHAPQNRRLFRSTKQSALRRGLEHRITPQDIVIPEYCPLLGIKLTNILGKGYVPTNASVDRVDNTKGYIPGNIQVVSGLANKMKHNATPEELITFATNILIIYAPSAKQQLSA